MSTGNKDFHEELLFLKIAKKFLQRKSKLKIFKEVKMQNRPESGKADQRVVNNYLGALLQIKSKNSE